MENATLVAWLQAISTGRLGGMKLTPRQIEVIRSNFVSLETKSRVAALAFYQRLFTLDPALRPLFKADIEAQAEKLMTLLRTAVELADQAAALQPILEALGRRHVGYGVRPEHYRTVGQALLWALGTTLGAEFNADAQASWTALYQQIADSMLGAGRPVQSVARLARRL